MNTRLSYLYRDANNFKQSHSVVIAGVLNFADIRDCLDGEYFIPSQVGLTDLQDRFEKGISSDDHVWHELTEEDLEPTPDEPTTDVPTADELKAAFMKARGNWDIMSSIIKLGLA